MSAQNRLSEIGERFREESPNDLRETHSFDWYLDLVLEEPEVARLSHQRLADMFEYYGSDYDEERDIVTYDMVSEDPLNDGENVFYGDEIHEAIHEFVSSVKSGARGLEPRTKVLLLLGDVGSGKSDFDRQMRRYFEDYTRRDAGKMYTFQWTNLCDVIDDQDPMDDTFPSQMNQDPLTLIPQDYRDEILEEANEELEAPYVIENEQSLDTPSDYFMGELLDHYNGDLQKVLDNHIEVVRLVADENKRRCIETFEPKDKKNQDQSELTGDVNYSKIGVYGESDPRAFDYDAGAFCNANRGIFSGEELLKLQTEFLYTFLHATEEQTIKPKKNPRIDIDQVIVGRTNLPDYRDTSSNEKMEAFNDRTLKIDFPYILSYSDEGKIYEKMVNNASVPEIHVEPHTYDMAGLFAVMTRLDEPDRDDISVVQKAKLYDGSAAEVDNIDVDKLREEASDNEGMTGVSPRFIGKEISDAIVSILQRDDTSLSPLTVLDYLEDDLEDQPTIDRDNYETYYTYIEQARDEYEDRAIEDVRHALAYNSEEIEEQGQKYLDNAMAYINDDTVEDEVTGELQEPDETFMRAVEEQLDIPQDRKDDFRQEVSNWISRKARRGESFSPQDNERLLRALEQKIWSDKKHNINFTALIKSDSANDEDRSEWVDALKERGYSEEGAKEVLEFAGAKVAKEEMEK